eukprot:CAMPEP_0194131662 /NCGR_PEP_ID=MMETSP0152-20130528/2387_1 /TAXON_ID=1049557 /ORGANISM="Thalassiothrix antarctica, Strain L6-D1" /LENGTH=547 /DNA_ID=CAMNT_0038826519 /DNA_START=25 /DNA_END=1668 /DNA_ORIENTATION=-
MKLFYLFAVTLPVLSDAQSECITNVGCSNHGTCTKSTVDDISYANDGGHSFCECDDNYYGLSCSNYCPITCKNGLCENDVNDNYKCNCYDNWGGPTCEISVAKCPDGTQCLDGNRCVKRDYDDESDEQKDIYECETVKCPEVPDTGCSICGPGMCITDEDAIFSFPGQPSVPCGILEKAGINGTIPLTQCKFLPPLVQEKCVCHSDTPGVIPVTPSPTPPNGLDPNSIGCQSKDDCNNHGECKPAVVSGDIDHSNSAVNVCDCDEDYFGASCYKYCPIDCVRGNCKEKGNGDYTCVCTSGWGGPACDVSVDECPDGSRCNNGARCVRSDDGDEEAEEKDSYSCEMVRCPPTPSDGCSICGPGLCVTAEKAIFSFPGQPTVPCGQLQEAGYDGVIPLDQCPFLPSLVKEKCGCHSASNVGLANSPTRPPTRPPSSSQGSHQKPESYFPPTPDDRDQKTRSPNYVFGLNAEPGLTSGAIAGIVIGSCVAFFLMIMGGAKLWSRSAKKLPRDATSAGVVLNPDGDLMKNVTKLGENDVEGPLNSHGAVPP